MTKIAIPRAVVEQALHVATGAGYPLALIAALRAALGDPQEPFALPCPTPKACKAHCCSGNCIPRSKA